MAKDEEVTVEYRPLADLMRHPRNPKGHDLPKLKDSFRRWGFVIPLVEDAATRQLVAGHGRLEALLQMQSMGEPAPKRIRVGKDGGWSVPVVSGVAFANEHEAEGFLIADNRLVEIGGWKQEELNEILKDFQLQGDVEGIGWTMEDLDKLLVEAETDHQRGPTPEQRLESFEAGVIKQVVLYFRAAEFESVINRLQRVMTDLGIVDDHTAAFLSLLDAYEAAHSNPQ